MQRALRITDDHGNPTNHPAIQHPFWIFNDDVGQVADGPFDTLQKAEAAKVRLEASKIPLHNDDMSKLPKGLYLALYHGRSSVDQDMDDWGYDGPLIGPIDYCHTTYASSLKFAFTRHEDFLKYKAEGIFDDPYDDCWLFIEKDLVRCAGKYYGDWTVFYNEKGC